MNKQTPGQSKRSRRHHYLPAFYQRRFTDANGLLWLFDLEKQIGKRLHPRNALVIQDFNTIETDDGPSDAVERGLAHIDTEGATALRRVHQGFWPAFGEIRWAISIFIAFQLTRGPRFRSQMDHLAHEVTSLIMKVQASRPDSVRRQMVEQSGEEPTELELQHEIERLSGFGERFTISNSRQSHIKTMLGVQESGQIASILFKRAWCLETSTSVDFITSDDPVTLCKMDASPLEGVGVMTADEVRFPISPRSCLVMHHPWVPITHHLEVPAARVLETNTRTIRQAHRFVLSRRTMTNFGGYRPEPPRIQMEQISGPSQVIA